jgi:hypothetical protein
MPSEYISSLPLLLHPQWTVEGYIFCLPGDAIPADMRRVGRTPDGLLLAAGDQPEPPMDAVPWPLRCENDDGSPFAFVETRDQKSVYVELRSFRTRLDKPDDEATWCVFHLAYTQSQTHLCDD